MQAVVNTDNDNVFVLCTELKKKMFYIRYVLFSDYHLYFLQTEISVCIMASDCKLAVTLAHMSGIRCYYYGVL